MTLLWTIIIVVIVIVVVWLLISNRGKKMGENPDEKENPPSEMPPIS